MYPKTLPAKTNAKAKIKDFFTKIGLHKSAQRQKSKFDLEIERWFSDRGDETLRLDYPNLSETSIVFDLGGYKGDFSAQIFEKYGCFVYLFEPHPEFYEACVERFKSNDKVIPINAGLSNVAGSFYLSDSVDGSSFLNAERDGKPTIKCEVRELFAVLEELDVEHIDLMKINIEGGEYPLLKHIVDLNKTALVDTYQIQFHNFIEDAVSQRDFIVEGLSKTHERTWCYEFVWENWKAR
ncbi:MAG: FkbM family methyltransferase [Paracoccaceae bacterium]|nr:FkbM family methyltransferase [Paracoccaceae bacterium]